MEAQRKEEKLGPLAIGVLLFIAAAWGFNFVVIKVGVLGMPPLLLAGLRFVLSVFPAIFFVKRPKVAWGPLAAYGIFLGVGEFGLLFTAIRLGAPAGISSIVLQSQAFLTALLAALVLKETIRGRTWAGLVVAALGLVLLALPQTGSVAALSPLLSLMVIFAAFFWAAANIVARRMAGANALGLMVWSSLFSPLPLFALSFIFEGREAIVSSLHSIAPVTIGALLYLAFVSTLAGYGLWNALIMRHGATKIAPFSLLVPIFSLSSATLFLGEQFTMHEALAALLIMGGLSVHLFWPSREKKIADAPRR